MPVAHSLSGCDCTKSRRVIPRKNRDAHKRQPTVRGGTSLFVYIPPVLVTGVTEGTLWSHMRDGTGYAAVRTRATLTLHTITIIPTIPRTGFRDMHPTAKLIQISRVIFGDNKTHASCRLRRLVYMPFTMDEMVLRCYSSGFGR